MRKCTSLGGRIFALLFILSVIFGSNAVYAKSNAWGEWQAVVAQDNVNDDDLLMSVKNTFAVELWHYSGGYWGNNFVRIYDRQVFDDPDELADAVNAVMEFRLPLPQEIISVLNDGYNVDVVLGANGIPLNRIFSLNKGFTFKYENNHLVFKAYPKFNFSTEYKYNSFVSGLSKQIPFVVAPYGYNRYAMWTKNGKSVGAGNGYFNPDNVYDVGAEGVIHPTHIANNKGHLVSDLNIYVDRENGTFDRMSSNNIAIGYNTFANAGAVAVHFDYPIILSFYRGGKMTAVPNDGDNNSNPKETPDNKPTAPKQPELPDENSTSCGEVIHWTENDSHTIRKLCSRHGSHTYTCNHKFIYETILNTEHNISPQTLKSGYGFEVNLNTSVTTRLVSQSGGCDNWGLDRTPDKKPLPPTKAEVRTGYTVTNILGTQGNSMALEKVSSNDAHSVFNTAANPISVNGSKTIFTNIDLPGTAENPAVHNFEIYVYGGGVNGIEFCKSIPETITINGSMYDDDGTTS